MNEPRQPFSRPPYDCEQAQAESWREMFKKLRLLYWLLVITGILLCTMGGYTLVSAIHHGDSPVYPILYLVGGFAFIYLANRITAMAAHQRGELDAKKTRRG